MNVVANPHALERAELARLLETDPDRGLTSIEAARRLERFGPNRPRRVRRPPYLRLVLNQFLDPLVALLVAAAAVSFAIGDAIEAAAIAAVLLVNAVLGFWQEAVAERAILALSEAFTHSAVVVRDGAIRTIPAEEVVPGDLLLVAEGERVAADARVVEARGLEVDESALTGESLPVTKQVEGVDRATPLAERGSMLYAGSGIARGRGRALVCATGMATELGAIEALAAEAKATADASRPPARASDAPDGRARPPPHRRPRRRDVAAGRALAHRVPRRRRRRGGCGSRGACGDGHRVARARRTLTRPPWRHRAAARRGRDARRDDDRLHGQDRHAHGEPDPRLRSASGARCRRASSSRGGSARFGRPGHRRRAGARRSRSRPPCCSRRWSAASRRRRSSRAESRCTRFRSTRSAS